MIKLIGSKLEYQCEVHYCLPNGMHVDSFTKEANNLMEIGNWLITLTETGKKLGYIVTLSHFICQNEEDTQMYLDQLGPDITFGE